MLLRAIFSLFLCIFAVCAATEREFSNSPLDAAAQPEYSALPLSVNVRFKTAEKKGYQIIAAHESKDSPRHWEIYTADKTGFFCAYAPKFFKGVLSAKRDVADGQWHEGTLVLGATQARLYCDGKLVASQPVLNNDNVAQGGALRVGGLVAGDKGFKGAIGAVRLARGESEKWDGGETLAHWVFDGSGDDLADRGPRGRNLANAKPYFEMGTPSPEPYVPQALPPYADFSARENSARALAQKLGLSGDLFKGLHAGVWSFWAYEFANYNRVDEAEHRKCTPLNRPDHEWRRRAADESFDRNATVWADDKGAVGTVLRRARALAEALRGQGADGAALDVLTADLDKIAAAWAAEVSPSEATGETFYDTACAVRRRIAFLNPLLDFNPVLAAARGTFEGSYRSVPRTSDAVGGHFTTQYFGFNALPAGGLFVFRNWRDGKPDVVDLLKDARVQNGRYRGQSLAGGAVVSPDLSFDGKKIVFGWSANKDHALNKFSRDTVFHIFTINADGSDLRQLTDGPYDDFDPCYLPNGRIAFVSERRGGHIRCFSSYLKVPNYTLFSMKDDGSDIVPMSYFETCEWNPSVSNDGKLVYTRWDYVDRENCIGGRFWIANPDGTNPRAPHGNYPKPYASTPEALAAFQKEFPNIPLQGWGSRWGTPLVQMGIRSIPNSHKYVFTAAPHHGQVFGSLGILDTQIPDDAYHSQVRRLTPDEPYPETELSARSHHKYGTPWPLSEDYYLANLWEDVVLVDKFGNREYLCGIRELPCFPEEKLRLIDPISLRARPTPPVIPTRAFVGEAAHGKDAPKATISIANVYETDLLLPEGVKIKWLRVVQNILKTNHPMGVPMIGNERENCPRIPLGIVPVEEDGSVYFKAPVGKELIFQLLDEEFRAVHSMRSVAFVFPGEQLSCVGCHEPADAAPSVGGTPTAFRRAPSDLKPELGTVEPISYYRQIRPIIERSCLPCHAGNAGPRSLPYEAFKEDSLWFSGGMARKMIGEYSGVHGGSRTIPGTFGARSSSVADTLLDDTHIEAVTPEERHAFFLWLDCNALRLGAFEDEPAQLRGECVWPALDVDPANPQGIDGTQPAMKGNFWHENRYGAPLFLAGSHALKKVFIMNDKGEMVWEVPAEAPQDVWMLDNGNVLFASLHAARIVNPAGETVWEYAVKAPNEIPTVQPLPDGNILVGVVGACVLREVNPAGEVVREIALQTPITRPHAQFRMCRKTAQGTYLVPFSDEGAVREYDASGKCIRKFPKMRFPVCAVRLKNGNTLITHKDGVDEFAPDGTIVWRVNPEYNIPDIAVAIPAGVQRLDNGNTLVCNWNAAEKNGKKRVHIFEITPDKRVVWEVDTDKIGKVAQCHLLDANRKPLPTQK